MGQRMPDIPIEYGSDCLDCFPAGETPKYLYVRFAEIEKCSNAWCVGFPPPPNDRCFKLIQQPGTPCLWTYPGSDWQIQYYAKIVPPTNSRLTVDSLPIQRNYFRGWTPAFVICQQFFQNQNTCVLNTCGVGGQAIITSSKEASDILESINLSKSSDLFLELFPLSGAKLVFKFCKLQDSTNIAILFEP